MNFTQNFYNPDLEDEIDYNISPEILINPRFHGYQGPDNLIELKLKVHSVLNVTNLFVSPLLFYQISLFSFAKAGNISFIFFLRFLCLQIWKQIDIEKLAFFSNLIVRTRKNSTMSKKSKNSKTTCKTRPSLKT